MRVERQEEEINVHLKKGDFKTAFQAILTHYKKPLYWHIRNILLSHEDTDDVLQNTFIKIWKNLSQFENRSKVYSWAYRIATNEALGFLKKRKQAESIDDNLHLENSILADEYFDGEEAHRILLEAIQTLPPKQLIIFNMKYFQQMKYSEIAEITKTTVGALKASYYHAVNKIEGFAKNKMN
ncbi:MAG: sigma-70 family RNA polymerase sigma factor [Flavobacteriales bacterium]|nr:sigma-70 family RNA polymerase sigma factor [Flavobacteriales bacterium]